MKARLVVFPIRGRNWCFGRSVDPAAADAQAAHTPSTLKDLWRRLSSDSKPLNAANAELLLDFASNKMNKTWVGLEKAPEGSFKNKLHGFGLRLLARVKPSEIFLKSISKEVSKLHVAYPSSLNARLVRRRLRHIALRGNFIHKKYFYGSVSLLPFTFAFSVLPLPNIPFFWISFRTYSHWQALQGSERLLRLVSDCSNTQKSEASNKKKDENHRSHSCPPVLEPSEELEKLLCDKDDKDGVSRSVVSDICKTFHLNKNDILKFWDSKSL